MNWRVKIRKRRTALDGAGSESEMTGMGEISRTGISAGRMDGEEDHTT